MAWFDIVGGLAKGTSQGLEQLQAAQQLARENKLKDAADARQSDEQKNRNAQAQRQADTDKEHTYAEAIARDNPDRLSPATLSVFKPEDLDVYTQMNPDGVTRSARMDPLKVQARTAATQAGEAAIANSAATIASSKIWNDPVAYDKQSDPNKIKIGLQAGKSMADIEPLLSPLFRESLASTSNTGYAARQQAGATVQVGKMATDRNTADNISSLTIAQLKDARARTDLQLKAIYDASSRLAASGMLDPEEQRAALKQIIEAAAPYAGDAAPAAPSSSGLRWDIATKTWK